VALLASRGEITLDGEALHAGGPASVTLRRGPGPLRFCWPGGVEARLDQLRVDRADLGVRLALGREGFLVDLVEHLLAAAAATGATEGLVIEPAGPELPLLDGGAARWCQALAALGFAQAPRPRLRVARPFAWALGASRYELTPGEGVCLEVTVDFDHPAIGRQDARWGGSLDEFIAEIAPARTFGFARERDALLAAGRARGARPGPVLIFDDQGPIDAELRWPDEVARHKLLDLLGDSTLGGGPVQGAIRAERPGHRANLAMMQAALAAGALVEAPR